jgi:negative regulator of flagellin synthesis FlgM
MDIRDVGSRNTRPPEESRAAHGVGQTPAARPAGDHADRVTLSQRAQTLQELRRAALESPDVRMERVDALRAKLADGSLVTDPARIARALLEQGVLGS